MATEKGMRNVRHTPVKLSESHESISVPVQVDDASDTMFLHQVVLSIDDNKGKRVVQVSSGTGLGGDFVVINYTDAKGAKHRGVCYMREIAAKWIEQIDPKAPKALLDALTPKRN